MTGPLSLEAVAPLAAHLDSPLVIVDVGCRWGPADVWSAFEPNVVVVGFDPDAAECERLERLSGSAGSRRFIPRALGAARSRAVLHLTSEPACSSLYEPNGEVLRGRPALECASPVGTAPIELSRLDDWARESNMRPDFLKLDTQGSELDVLTGATDVLPSVHAIEVEVEFNPIYSGQPLFGDVDAFLRQRGFVLWRLRNLVHYGIPGVSIDVDAPDVQYFDSESTTVAGRGGQLFWANAYYVRDPVARRGESAPWQALLREACISSALGFRDLAAWGLARALKSSPPDVAAQVRSVLG